MSLILLNLQSNQQIKLNSDTPLIIGRGNVEGCFDKRVSRNHGRITCTIDGKVRLAALHCNPCFFTRNGVPPVLQLNKDEEETLNEGDYLGLLPNAFWFKVTSSKENEIKDQSQSCVTRTDVISDENNQTIVLSDNCNISPSSQKEILISKESESAICDKPNKNNSSLLPSSTLKRELNSEGTSRGFGTPEFEKTRRLPVWMYEIDDSNDSNKHSLEDATCTKEKKQKKQKVLSETRIKKEFEVKSIDQIKVEDEIRNVDIPSTSKVEGTDGTSTSDLVSKFEPEEELRKDNTEKEGYESGIDENDLESKRPICQYEGNCYRKNPQHKLEFSHPGDSDFVPYEERPLCQYGPSCYRRSEKHKIEFRHPSPGSSSQNLPSASLSPSSRASSPLPAKRRRKNVNKQGSDYEDEDEYDLEDPFINDASSDEYLPSDLESEEEEDYLDAS